MTAENSHFQVPELLGEIFLSVIGQSLIKMDQLIQKTFEVSPVTARMIVELHPFRVRVY